MSTTGKIQGVAIFYDNEYWYLPAPNRHYHIIRWIAAENGKGISGPDVQGFYDEFGVFLNRKEAFLRAVETGQLKRDPNPGKYQGAELYSEDLW